jgi:uncharacterized protein YecT (DUF1311 family)
VSLWQGDSDLQIALGIVMKIAWLIGFLVVFSTSSWADDEPDCKDPQDQMTMTFCAGKDFQKADTELNDAWVKFKADAEDSDKATDSHEYSDALLASQRAWIAFRDAECDWQGFAAHGGSMEPMLVEICLAKLTRDRIKQLQTGVSE